MRDQRRAPMPRHAEQRSVGCVTRLVREIHAREKMVDEFEGEDGIRDVWRLQLVTVAGHASGQNGGEGEAPVFIRTDAPEPRETRRSCPPRIGRMMVHAVVVRLPEL